MLSVIYCSVVNALHYLNYLPTYFLSYLAHQCIIVAEKTKSDGADAEADEADLLYMPHVNAVLYGNDFTTSFYCAVWFPGAAE